MQHVIIVIHLMLVLALIGVVLLQRSEGGALGIGGGGGGAMTGRGAANLLTRTTAGLAAAFMLTSILLAIVSGTHSAPSSILDAPASSTSDMDKTAPMVPEKPAEPSAPLSE